MTPWIGPSETEVRLDDATLDLLFGVICLSNVVKCRRNRRVSISVMREVFADMAYGKRLVLVGPYSAFMIPPEEWVRIPLADAPSEKRGRINDMFRRLAIACDATFDPLAISFVR